MHYQEAEFRDLVKRDESIFRFLEKRSLDGLWYRDLTDGVTGWMNPEFWRLFGCDSTKMPNTPEAWYKIVHPDDLKAALENLQHHLDDPYIPYDQILRCTHQVTGKPSQCVAVAWLFGIEKAFHYECLAPIQI